MIQVTNWSQIQGKTQFVILICVALNHTMLKIIYLYTQHKAIIFIQLTEQKVDGECS